MDGILEACAPTPHHRCDGVGSCGWILVEWVHRFADWGVMVVVLGVLGSGAVLQHASVTFDVDGAACKSIDASGFCPVAAGS